MAFKFVVAFALVAVVSAGYVPQPQVYHAAPVAHTVAVAHEPQHILTKSVEEYDHHPQYNVAYNVHDSITGDVKSQSESRDGDVVNGEYSLIDADGYKRTVTYSADDHHGFNAVVNRVPLHEGAQVSHETPAVVKHLTPVVHASPSHTYAAPAIVKTIAPVSYTAPSYQQTVSAPSVEYAAPSHYKAAPVTYTTSNLVKTVNPVTYAAAAPSHLHQYVSSPTYTAPANYHVHAQPTYPASVNYHVHDPQPQSTYAAHAQPIYVAPSVVKTVSPVISASPIYYKSAPSVAYTKSESAPAYVKSSEHSNQYHH